MYSKEDLQNKIKTARDITINIYPGIGVEGERILIENIISPLQYIEERFWIISIAYSILMNHVYNDGNKRTALNLIVLEYDANPEFIEVIVLDCINYKMSREEFIRRVYAIC